MRQAAQNISRAVWAVSTLPGMHLKLESLTKAKQAKHFVISIIVSITIFNKLPSLVFLKKESNLFSLGTGITYENNASHYTERCYRQAMLKLAIN